MDALLYYLVLGLVKGIQALPLPVVALAGRAGGALAYWCDWRHRRVALQNLAACFGAEKSAGEIRKLAKENFKRIGESYCCAIKTTAMSWEQLRPRCEFVGAERLLPPGAAAGPLRRVVAIGHFGNFELYARFGQFMPGFQCATTYRGLRQPSLNRLLRSLRERSGCLFFERRAEAAALKQAMAEKNLLLGLLADQSAGTRGLWLPFLGRGCSTTAAPAIFALRYHCPLHAGICYRVGLARWRIEAGAEISTRQDGQARTVEAITLDINRAFEAAVRRDPANWFWVHNRWKPIQSRRPEPASPAEPMPAVAPATKGE